MVDFQHVSLSVNRQCELLGLCRASFYYRPHKSESELEFNFRLMKRLDELYLGMPYYGSRRMTEQLKLENYPVNRKRISRLMGAMGIEAIYPRKKLSISNFNSEHRIYPYLLHNVRIRGVDHVWSTDITYIPMRRGFLYLVAIMDWYSRYVVSWELSQTLEKYFCISALERALCWGVPEIFNSDQGSQFTSHSFTRLLLDKGVLVSMDGRGRVFDNIFIERLWRTVKQEEVYLKNYETVREAERELGGYFEFYNNKRLHQSLGYRPPVEIYRQKEMN